MKHIDIGTKEFRERNKGNLMLLGDDKQVHRPMGKRSATRADWLYEQKLLGAIQRDNAIIVMGLAKQARACMSGMSYEELLTHGRSIKDADIDNPNAYDLLLKIGMRLQNPLWARVDAEILDELRQHGDGFSTRYPSDTEAAMLTLALDRIDNYITEFRGKGWVVDYV